MGGRNARLKEPGLGYYGGGYDPYYPYGNMENYGSSYQPVEEEYPLAYEITDRPFVTTRRPFRGAPGQGGLGRYGNSYPPGFNPILQGGSSRPKVRVIYVPDHVVAGFRNVLQQGAAGGLNPWGGGIGAYGGPQIPYSSPMTPQMPGAFPMMPPMPGSNVPFSPMGSNCFSMSVPASSVPPQFSMPMPMPCPPPMIQPVMIPMRKILERLSIPLDERRP